MRHRGAASLHGKEQFIKTNSEMGTDGVILAGGSYWFFLVVFKILLRKARPMVEPELR